MASAGNETNADLACISFPGLYNMSAEGEEPQPHVKEDNPFSFKTFLKRSSDGGGDGKPPKREGQKRKGRTPSRTGETLPFPELEETGTSYFACCMVGCMQLTSSTFMPSF